MDTEAEKLRGVRLKKYLLSDVFDIETLILSSIGDVIMILSTDMKYLYWNKAAEQLTGVSTDYSLGKTPLELFPGVEHKYSYPLFEKVLKEKETIIEEPFSLLINSREIWINRRIFPIIVEKEVVGFAVLITDVTRQKNDELKILEQLRELENKNILLNNELNERLLLEKKIREIEEIERNRMAMNIHDSIGQHITGIRYLLGQLISRMNREKSPYKSALHKILTLLDETKDMIRRIVHNSALLQMAGSDFEASVIQMLNKIESIFPVYCTCDFQIGSLINQSKINDLYFIIQELITNMIKHGKVEKIDVHIYADNERVSIDIRHDGIFPIEPEKGRETGMGLKIINYRLTRINGKLKTVQDKNKETIIHISTGNLETG